MKCAVWSCKNERGDKNTKLSFFSFPKDKKLLKKWLHFCGKDIKKFNAKTFRICMEHFKADDMEGQLQFDMGLSCKRFLKPGVAPSIYGNEVPKPSDVNRVDRLNKRNNKKIVESLLLEAESIKKEDTSEPEVDQSNNENDSFIESISFSANTIDNNLFLSNNPEGISLMDCKEEKSQLEEQVKTLQNEVKFLKSENFKINQNLLTVEKKLSYEIANLKEQLLKKEIEY